jgi:hypothetical protein
MAHAPIELFSYCDVVQHGNLAGILYLGSRALAVEKLAQYPVKCGEHQGNDHDS